MKLVTSLVAAAVLATGTASHAQENPLTEVADGVYHFFAMGYASMVVVGENGVLVTDPAFKPRAELLKVEIGNVTDKPITHVVMSHEHFDHIGGGEVFDNAEFIMQENGVDVLKLSPLMPVPTIDTTFDDVMSVDLGGQTVELHHIAVGDGVATTVVRVAESNVVYSADLYNDKSFSPKEFKEDTNFVGVSVILNTMVDWNPAYAINGHSAGNSKEAMIEYAVFMNDLKDVVEARYQAEMASGGDPWALLFTIADEIKLPEYDSWEGYEGNFPWYVNRMSLSIMHGG